MAKNARLIPFRSVNLTALTRRIDKVIERTRKHLHTEPTGVEFETFVQDMYACFPLTIRYDVFYTSVMMLAGSRLTPEVIRATAWRLAANIPTLRKGTPVPPWIRQLTLEWAPIQILRGNPGRSHDGKFGFFYEYVILAGTAAGLRFTTFWSLNYLKFVARSVGFKKTRKGNFRLVDGQELVRMRLYLLFDPMLSRDDRPIAYHFFVPESCRKFNRRILLQRNRVIPCPEGFPLAAIPCYQCFMGYDKCLAGCHPKTFVEKGCPRCSQVSFFDPLGKGVICIECEDKERRSHASSQ